MIIMRSHSSNGSNSHLHSSSTGDILFILFVVFPVSIGIFLLMRLIRNYYRSFQFKRKTDRPSFPTWMNIGTFRQTRSISEENGFRIHQKSYSKQIWMDKKGKTKEKEKLIILMMRKMLEEVLGIPIEENSLPDSTCVISIPKKCFKSGNTPGEFILKYGNGRFNSYFEYQMIGDDRIQVVYYVADGIKYVAGICIYIQNPYESIIHYRESIVKKLLNETEYWPAYSLEKESMEIVRRKNGNKQMLMTKNSYGEMKQWILNGDLKSFKSIGPLTEASFVIEEGTDPKLLSKSFIVKICQSKKKIVMISIRNGEKMHAEWDKTTKLIHYFKCETCNEPEDTPPPSYHSIKKSFS